MYDHFINVSKTFQGRLAIISIYQYKILFKSLDRNRSYFHIFDKRLIIKLSNTEILMWVVLEISMYRLSSIKAYKDISHEKNFMARYGR